MEPPFQAGWMHSTATLLYLSCLGTYWILAVRSLTAQSVLLPLQRLAMARFWCNIAVFIGGSEASKVFQNVGYQRFVSIVVGTAEALASASSTSSQNAQRPTSLRDHEIIHTAHTLCLLVMLSLNWRHVVEGRLHIAITFSLLMLTALNGVAHVFKAGEYILPLMRLNVVAHGILWRFKPFDPITIRRSIMESLALDMLQFEALDESFVHLLFLLACAGWPDEVVRFAFIQYTMLCLFMATVPIRKRLLGLVHDTRNKMLLLASLTVPSQILVVALDLKAFSNPPPAPYALSTIGAVLFVMGAIALVYSVQTKGWANFVATPPFDPAGTLVVLLYLFAALLAASNFLQPLQMLFAALLICILSLLSVYMRFPRFFLSLAVHLISLHSHSTVITLVLTSARILQAFESRPFQVVAAEVVMLNGVCMFGLPWEVLILNMLGVTSSLCYAFILSQIRQLGDALRNIEIRQQDFLDHALKQKFAGADLAIEHTLNLLDTRMAVPQGSFKEGSDLSVEKNNDDALALSLPLIRKILVQAVNETRMGHDMCHVASVVSKIRQGTYQNYPEVRELSNFVQDLRKRLKGVGLFSPVKIEAPRVNIIVQLEWELLHLIIFQLLDRHGHHPFVRIMLVIKHNATKQTPVVEGIIVFISPDTPARSAVVENVKLIAARLGACSSIEDINGHLVKIPITGLKVLSISGLVEMDPFIQVMGDSREDVGQSSRTLFPISHHVAWTKDFTRSSASESVPHKFSQAKALGRKCTSECIPHNALLIVQSVEGERVCSIQNGGNISRSASIETFCRGLTVKASSFEELKSANVNWSSYAREGAVQSKNTDQDTEIPSGLVFAVLDDVAVVRKGLMRLLTTSLHISPNQFSAGATVDEVLSFPNNIINTKPNVILVDQYLDFDETDESILGADIARKIRRDGYRGALILHSANDLLRDSLDVNLFDGFLSKTFNMREIAQVVARALCTAHARMKEDGMVRASP